MDNQTKRAFSESSAAYKGFVKDAAPQDRPMPKEGKTPTKPVAQIATKKGPSRDSESSGGGATAPPSFGETHVPQTTAKAAHYEDYSETLSHKRPGVVQANPHKPVRTFANERKPEGKPMPE